jgi:glycosyltransferase involved in cell wall biosynthesis
MAGPDGGDARTATGLRIVHVQPMTLDLYGYADEDLGGAVRYAVTNLAIAQARLGNRPEIHLLASRRPHTQMLDNNVPVTFHSHVQPPRHLSVRWRFARQFSLSMLRAIRRDRGDVIHFHGVRQMHPMYAAAAWRTERQGMPLIAQDRGDRPVGRIETALQRYALRRTQVVLAASAGSADVLAGMGVPRSALHVVSNAMDPAVFWPGEPRESDGIFRVLVISRLNEDKDPLTMAEALCELVRRNVRVAVTVISRGVLRGAVEDRLRSGNVPATFIDHVAQGELGTYYRAADAFVLTSLREGWNQTIIEAMACGLPVVHTDVPGPRDSAGGAGYAVPPAQPLAVADALERLARDPALRREYRARGLARAPQFTWDAVARQIQPMYAQATALLANGGARAGLQPDAHLGGVLS